MVLSRNFSTLPFYLNGTIHPLESIHQLHRYVQIDPFTGNGPLVHATMFFRDLYETVN